ncbi:hypothetical protein ACWGKX_30430, partial [Streptomyces tricolor]
MSEVAVPYRARPHRRWTRTAAVVLAVAAASTGGPAAEPAEAVPPQRVQRVEYFPGPGAEPRRVTVPADTPAARRADRAPDPAVRPLQRAGPGGGRGAPG